jgi:ABC-type transport system involved in cytochrome c biogenesis permease subunit
MNSQNPVSPKVIVGVFVGFLFTALASNVTALTPDLFDFLGPWKLFVFGVVLTLIKAVAEYYKADPLRVVPTPVTSEVVASGTPVSTAEMDQRLGWSAPAQPETPAAPAVTPPSADPDLEAAKKLLAS